MKWRSKVATRSHRLWEAAVPTLARARILLFIHGPVLWPKNFLLQSGAILRDAVRMRPNIQRSMKNHVLPFYRAQNEACQTTGPGEHSVNGASPYRLYAAGSAAAPS